ncbi:MAG: hypothetical protein ABSE91_00220 [Patescibacteria group bacterium]|jgi:hypothetical protein
MLEADCLFVPLGLPTISTPAVMAVAVKTLFAHDFIPRVDLALKTEVLQAAIKASRRTDTQTARPVIAAFNNINFAHNQLAVCLGFDIIEYEGAEPDELAPFAALCAEAGVYGLVHFNDPGVLELMLASIEDPNLLAAHLDYNECRLKDYAVAYRRVGLEPKSQIAIVSCPITWGTSWQRIIRHQCGFELIPGLVLTDVFAKINPNDTEAIKHAIANAREHFTPFTGHEPVG